MSRYYESSARQHDSDIMEFSEIAERLGQKLSAVKMTYSRGMKRLRKTNPDQLKALLALVEERNRLEQQRISARAENG
jgi:hypothetical protein